MPQRNKTLAVRFEGTLVDAKPGEGYKDPKPNVIEALKLLAPDWDIMIVSTEAGTSLGLQRLVAWLREHEVPYWDVWSGFALPHFDHMIDDQSLPLNDETLKLLGAKWPKETKK